MGGGGSRRRAAQTVAFARPNSSAKPRAFAFALVSSGISTPRTVIVMFWRSAIFLTSMESTSERGADPQGQQSAVGQRERHRVREIKPI